MTWHLMVALRLIRWIRRIHEIDEKIRIIGTTLDSFEGRFETVVEPIRTQINAEQARLEQILNEV